MKIIKQIFYFIIALAMIYYIYVISIMLAKVGFKDISRDFYFASLSIYLAVPLLKSVKLKKDIDIYALDTLEKINKSVKILGDETNRLNDVILKKDNIERKIDNIIITDKGIFNIVRCNYKGQIYAKDDKTWYINKKKKLEGVKSPIDNIIKNRELLSTEIEGEKILDLIIMMNDRADIEGENNCSVDIIRYNEIGNYIMNYSTERDYNEEQLYDKIYPLIYKFQEIKSDKNIYKRFIENKWKYRGRVFISLISFIFYIKNII